MRVLSRALKQQGDPIPLPWPELPIRPGPGDVVEVLAAPGVGKSFTALNWAHYVAKQGLPVLMHSTDTDYADQAVRLAALEFGATLDEIERNQEIWASRLARVDLPIRWSDIHVAADEFADLMKAEVEYLGEAPKLTVVDVVGDMLGGQEENVGAIRNIFTQLKKVARRFHTTVLALHHVKRGPAASGTSVVKLADGLYGGEQVVQAVLGLWRPGEQTLRVAVLKNRMGKAQPEGLLAVDLRYDPTHSRVASRLAVAV